MTATPPSRINLPPVPTSSDIFARSSHNTHSHSRSHLTPTPSDTSPSGSPGVPYAQGLGRGRRRSAVRQSFSTANNASLRARRVSRMTNPDGTDLDIPDEELEAPKLPTLVPGIRPAYSTPLPVLPMVVLCLVSPVALAYLEDWAQLTPQAMLSELLSANLATPFLLKMVEGFFLSSGHEKNSETEAAVGLWTGESPQTLEFAIKRPRTSLISRQSRLRFLHHAILHFSALERNRRSSWSKSSHCG